MNRKYLLAAPALVIVILEANWDAQSDASPLKKNFRETLDQGRQVFRFDTFGDESFGGDQLRLHQSIEDTRFGGVGRGLSPKTALAAGLNDRRRFLLRLVLLCGSMARPVMAGEETKRRTGKKAKG